jgi:NAD(P)-dependent dehydrogenase (short-subunit alcohol dehydrogenase family)
MTTDKNKSSETMLWLSAAAGALVAGTLIYREITRYRVAGKVILITGGSRGLGLQLAQELGRKGARIVICARSEKQLQHAASSLREEGVEVIAITADVTSRPQVSHMVDEVVRSFGSIDVLINNAGIIQVGPQDAMVLEDYQVAMDTNFWAPLYAMHAVLPHFFRKGEGRIVNITSIGGKVAVPHLLPYSASKFALVGLSEGMHAELKKHNILVTTVVPNLMRTGSPRNAIIKGRHEKEYAWFKIADSSPLLSQHIEVAARNIVRALEYGESEAILSFTAKLTTLIKGVAPSWVNFLLSIVNRLLPDGNGSTLEKKGYQSESAITSGRLARRSDDAALANNEI